jgi:hypothetical protein
MVAKVPRKLHCSTKPMHKRGYARVMQVLRLEGDLALLGVDDVLGRKLQDAGITPKLRAPKRASGAKVETVQGRD